MFESFRKPQSCGPFDGEPKTVALVDHNGNLTGFRIEARYLTPEGAKEVRGVALGLTFALVAAGLGVASEVGPVIDHALDGAISANEKLSTDILAAAYILSILSYFLLKKLARWLLSKRTIIEITREELRVKKLFRWRVWDRRAPHRFSLLPHDKAQAEWLDENFKVQKAAQRGKVIQPKRWYQDSRHVVFELIYQRIDIAVVYGVKEARALQARLTGCAEAIDAVNGGVGALQPQDEWAAGPGDLPNA